MTTTCPQCGHSWLEAGKAKRRKPQTEAPERLTPPEMELLRAWCKLRHPWALNPPERLDALVEACLLHWGSKGELRASWLKTVQTWVMRSKEFGRDQAHVTPPPRPRPAERPAPGLAAEEKPLPLAERLRLAAMLDGLAQRKSVR